MWKSTISAIMLTILSLSSVEAAFAASGHGGKSGKTPDVSMCWTKCGGLRGSSLNPQPLPPG